MTSQSLTTLARVRKLMDTPDANTAINDELEILIDAASAKIRSYCHRNFRLKTYTEYHDGDGTPMLSLKQFPVSSITSIYDDPSMPRAYSSDYLLDSDYYTFTPETGIVRHLTRYFRRDVNNIQAIYVAGYDEFEILTGYNDAIDFNEGGAELNATLDEGTYTADELETEIETQLEAEGAGTYTAAYNIVTGKFTITQDTGGTFQVLWLSGTNTLTSAGLTLGYDITADDTGALFYTADNGVLGIPDDLQFACAMLVQDMLDEGRLGQNRQGLTSISSGVPGGGNTSFIQDAFPIGVETILNSYRMPVIP